MLRRAINYWYDAMDNRSDPRVNEYFLMSSPIPTTIICLCYVYAVKKILPQFMEHRKPLNLKKILIVYNLCQAVFSFGLFVEASRIGWFRDYNWRCQPIDRSRSDLAMRMVRVSWLYYVSKYSEFLDTIFFILRKRNDLVTNLHVIHHGIMPFSVWWGLKFLPGGHITFFGFLNSFVHVVMYTYYMLAAMGREMQRYLWWKKYLTMFQMIQFTVVLLHSCQLFLHNPCNYPILSSYWTLGHSILFLSLFTNFYIQAYIKSKKKKKTK